MCFPPFLVSTVWVETFKKRDCSGVQLSQKSFNKEIVWCCFDHTSITMSVLISVSYLCCSYWLSRVLYYNIVLMHNNNLPIRYSPRASNKHELLSGVTVALLECKSQSTRMQLGFIPRPHPKCMGGDLPAKKKPSRMRTSTLDNEQYIYTSPRPVNTQLVLVAGWAGSQLVRAWVNLMHIVWLTPNSAGSTARCPGGKIARQGFYKALRILVTTWYKCMISSK